MNGLYIRLNVVIVANQILEYVWYRSNAQSIMVQSRDSATCYRCLDSIPHLLVVQPLLERCRTGLPIHRRSVFFTQVLNMTVLPATRTSLPRERKLAQADIGWQN